MIDQQLAEVIFKLLLDSKHPIFSEDAIKKSDFFIASAILEFYDTVNPILDIYQLAVIEKLRSAMP